jgi:heptosyltransferase-1
LRSKQYDKVIDTQGLARTGLISKIARGERHGYDRDSIREKFASRFYNVRHAVPRDIHAIARNRALTGLALGYEPAGEPAYGLERAALAGVPSMPYAILLHATAEKRKEWPEENWVALGRAFEDRVNLLLPWGSEAERERAERIAGQIKRAQVPIRRELDDMARMIAGASFVVGVDTGLLHLAAALGVPLAGIFVGSERALTGPVGSGPIAIVGARGAPPSVEEAVAAVEKIGAKADVAT